MRSEDDGSALAVLVSSIGLAMSQLARNKMRTALTSLGVLIGVAAVIAMVDIGQAATRQVESDLSQLGDNVLFVVPGSPGQRGPPGPARPLTLSDVRAIRRSVPGVRSAAATASRGVVARFGDATWRTAVQGTESAWRDVGGWEVARGRLFNEGEEVSGAPVCVLGETVASELFGSRDPLGQTLRVGDLSCSVIGTMAAKGENTFGQDQDDYVLVPIATYHRRIAGNRDVHSILVSGVDGVPTAQVKEDLEALMRERRHIRPGAEEDFVVRDLQEIQSMLGSISSVLTSLLASIAAVSLLVGGIGIMNIMTVSVTERTREIGIRLAVGALARDVLLQFLVEAVVLSVLGGLAGIVLGSALSYGVARGLALTPVVDPRTIGVAFGVSVVIGVLFGFWPARKAARMRPIDALRHE